MFCEYTKITSLSAHTHSQIPNKNYLGVKLSRGTMYISSSSSCGYKDSKWNCHCLQTGGMFFTAVKHEGVVGITITKLNSYCVIRGFIYHYLLSRE